MPVIKRTATSNDGRIQETLWEDGRVVVAIAGHVQTFLSPDEFQKVLDELRRMWRLIRNDVD